MSPGVDTPRRPRIGSLPRLPLMMRLSDRPCLVVGAGDVGRWKAEALAACGARVTIVDPAAPSDLSDHGITVERRAFLPADVLGRALVVAATPDLDTNGRVAAAARAAGIPVNVVDAPKESDVIFPAIVDCAPIVIAISTEASAPVLARQLRRRIEAILPETLGDVARFAAAQRGAVKAAIPATAARRRFWERFFDAAFAVDELTDAKLDVLYRCELGAEVQGSSAPRPCVHVVEAPLHPDELSLRALRLLNAADTLVYDSGVAEAVIHRARREARHLPLHDGAAATAEGILADATADAVGRRCVVWLWSSQRTPLGDLGGLKQRLNSRGVMMSYLASAPSPVD